MAGTRRGSLAGRFAGLPRKLGAAAGAGTLRFPVAAVLICIFALVSNLELADWSDWPEWPRILSALGGAAAASVAMRVGAEARLAAGSRRLALLPALAALVIGLVMWFGEPLTIYGPALLPALLFAIPLAPFAGRGTARQFWTFTLWAAVGVTLAFISVLVFALGLTAILEMVRFLFDIGPGSRAYRHIFITAFTLVGPLFALGRVPSFDGEELVFSPQDRLVAAVRPLFDWVAAPLVLVTALVLHLYALRIVVTGEVPVGEVGWIVTFFAILVLGLRIAIDPFLEGGAAPARLFGCLWAALLVVPLALLGYAAWLRIGDHGFTIDRYYLVLGGIAAALALVCQLWPRLRGDIRAIAAVPTILLALSVAGPWSAAEIVERSQIDRIAEEFGDERGMLEAGALDHERRWALRSRLAELEDIGRLASVAALVPQDRLDAIAALDDSPDAFLRTFGITALARPLDPAGTLHAGGPLPLDIEGFDRASLNLLAATQATQAPVEEVALLLEGAHLVVALGGVRDRVDLTQAIAAMMRGSEVDGTITDPDFDLTTEEGRRLRLRFANMTLDEDAVPQNALVTILWRQGEWKRSLGGG